MLVTLLGIVMLFRLVQPAKTESPMLLTPLPIATFVRLVAIFERRGPDAGDIGEDRDASETGAERESFLTDAGDAIAYRDARQAGAA